MNLHMNVILQCVTDVTYSRGWSHRFHRLMLSRVKPIHALVEKTIHDLETAEQKMKSLDSKRLVSRNLCSSLVFI